MSRYPCSRVAPSWLPAVGAYMGFTDDECDVLEQKARQRHAVDASNTRGAGTNYTLHLKGVLAEGAVLRLIGREVDEVKALETVDLEPDIVHMGDAIEVKANSPVESKTKVRDPAWYVVVAIDKFDVHGWHRVTATSCSAALTDDAMELTQLERGENWRPESIGRNFYIPRECACVVNAVIA